MAHWMDYLVDQVKNSWTEAGESSDDAALTTTHAAVIGRHHVGVKFYASYENSTVSGLLQVTYGLTVIAQKDIHGSGNIDFGDLGFQNSTVNSLISATLAAGGAGVKGHLTLVGYSTGADA